MATIKKKNADGTWEPLQVIGEDMSKKPNVYRQTTEPDNVPAGTWWLDPSDNQFQGTVFANLDSKIEETNAQLAQNAKYRTNFINVRQAPYHAKGDGVTDDTAAIQQAINDAAITANTYGLNVLIPKGLYIVSGLTVPSYVTLMGEGKLSVLKHKANSTAALIRLASNTSQMVNLLNFSVNGNKANQVNAVRGIEIINTLDAVAIKAESKIAEHDARHYIENIHILETKGDGFLIEGRGESQIKSITTQRCDGIGIVIDAQDNIYTDLSAGDSGLQGVYIKSKATNTRMSTSKAWFSGRLNNSIGNGFMIECKRVTIANCESQDNAKHGFVFASKGITGSALIADANGWDYTNGTIQSDSVGFMFYNANNCNIQGVALDRFELLADRKQNFAFSFTGTSKGNKIDLTVEHVKTDLTPTGQLPNLDNFYHIVWNRDDGSVSKLSNDYLTASAVLDFPSIPAHSTVILTVGIAGARAGNSVSANPTSTGIEGGLMWSAWVSADNQVTIMMANITTTPIDPTSRGWRVSVIK
jgi:hypothetical protein